MTDKQSDSAEFPRRVFLRWLYYVTIAWPKDSLLCTDFPATPGTVPDNVILNNTEFISEFRKWLCDMLPFKRCARKV